MKINELKKELAAALNGVEGLVQRGCKAFAEDSRNIYKEADKWVSAGKTAIVVVAPERRRNSGASASAGTSPRVWEKFPLPVAPPPLYGVAKRSDSRTRFGKNQARHVLCGEQYVYMMVCH